MASLLLLANFYGNYLDTKKFKNTIIVNNAGIEQLATLGVEEVKSFRLKSDSRVYVVVVAGLTDMLLKSVDEAKGKLEITPNSIQLIKTKMEWATSVLQKEGASVIWAIMPPISLKNYHQAEGWDVYRIPSMSPGLDREQNQLNNLMYNFRDICAKSNKSQGLPGLYLTEQVADTTKGGGIMLVTSLFEADGLTPTKRLIDIWDREMEKFTGKLHHFDKSRGGPPNLRDVNNAGRNWRDDFPRDRGDSDIRGRSDVNLRETERSLKRSYEDDRSRKGGLLSLADSLSTQNGSRDFRDDRRPSDPSKRSRTDDYRHSKSSEKSRSDNIPSLLDLGLLSSADTTSSSNPMMMDMFKQMQSSQSSGQQNSDMQTMMQMMLQASNSSGSNNTLQMMMNFMQQQQRQQLEQERKKKEEEERLLALRQKLEDERLLALQKQAEEERRLEMKRREEESRRRELLRRAEEVRRAEELRREELRRAELRRAEEARRAEVRQLELQRKADEDRIIEIQKKAKATMEQQAQQDHILTIQTQFLQAKLLAEQRAKLQMMTSAAKKAKESEVPSLLALDTRSSDALDRLNAKYRMGKSERDHSPPRRSHSNIVRDLNFRNPVVLFSYTNSQGILKPLRGIRGPRVKPGDKKTLSDHKSRNVVVYERDGASAPTLGLLKLKISWDGDMTEFDKKVAGYNNSFMELKKLKEELMEYAGKYNISVYQEQSEVVPSKKQQEPNTKIAKTPVDDKSPKTVSTRTAAKDKKSDKLKKVENKSKKPNEARSRSHDPGKARIAAGKSNTERGAKQKNERRSMDQAKKEPVKPRWDHSDTEDDLVWDDETNIIDPIKQVYEDDNKSVKSVVMEQEVKGVEEIKTESSEKNVLSKETGKKTDLAESVEKPSGDSFFIDRGDVAAIEVSKPPEQAENSTKLKQQENEAPKPCKEVDDKPVTEEQPKTVQVDNPDQVDIVDQMNVPVQMDDSEHMEKDADNTAKADKTENEAIEEPSQDATEQDPAEQNDKPNDGDMDSHYVTIDEAS